MYPPSAGRASVVKPPTINVYSTPPEVNKFIDFYIHDDCVRTPLSGSRIITLAADGPLSLQR